MLVNHDPRLNVDVGCANLAIKYNMLYLSVWQLIKENIAKHSPIGLRLQESYEEVKLSEAYSQVGVVDAAEEMQYTAAHYDMRIVMELLE